jgi:fatty-acid desaturase
VAVEHRDRADRNVAVVTDVPRSRVDELRQRQRRYLWTMAFRTALFILAILLYLYVGVTEAIVAGVISTVLPWVAVVAANAGPHRSTGRPRRYLPSAGNELGGSKPDKR